MVAYVYITSSCLDGGHYAFLSSLFYEARILNERGKCSNGILPWGTSSHFLQWHTKKGNLWCVTDSNATFSSFHLFSISQKKDIWITRKSFYCTPRGFPSTSEFWWNTIFYKGSEKYGCLKTFFLCSNLYQEFLKHSKRAYSFFKTCKCLTKHIFKDKCFLKIFIGTFKQFSIIIIQVSETFVIQI